MTYKINGADILIQPTSGRWLPREVFSYDGNGHPIYSGVRKFEVRWQLMDASGTNQLQTFFDNSVPTGTVVVDLPRFGYAPYDFFSYSGCVIHEPEYNRYFVENTTDIILLITNIVT